MNTVSVVVAERGSDWLSWAGRLRARANSTIVLAQPCAEDDAAFTRRVAARILRLTQEGASVDQAAFITGDRTDASAQVQRGAILRRLALLLTNRGHDPQLYVDGASSAGPDGARARRMMRALAWAIADLARGSGLRILLGSAREESPTPVSIERPLPAL